MQHHNTGKPCARNQRERRTIAAMIAMYCRGQAHAERGQNLCLSCLALLDYAERRLERCVFGDDKPTCANCVVHCYSAEKREQVRVVMSWAGPRMLLRHPVLAISHLLDGRRPAPDLPARSSAEAQPRRSGSGID